jgi:hypothetical protein
MAMGHMSWSYVRLVGRSVRLVRHAHDRSA